MNDADILQLSLNKYKDQEGRKAKALKERIDCFKALNEIYEKVQKEQEENQRIPNPGS